MKNKYSIFSLIKNAFSYHENWEKAWKDPEPKKEYDAVIVGGGGHGLATAYYLAKKHNMKNIAVVEKGWIGGGNTGRNTTIIRQESEFDLGANSHAGAKGLMQLMPYTAKVVAKQAKLPYSKSRLTRDAEYNINLGSHYIAGPAI